ncbi:MAG: phospholipase D-like domain-containing protein [Vulcanimicrobiaceae bacterium]
MPFFGRAYPSPTLVLLAWDWPDGSARTDFVGFSIARSPGVAAVSGGPRPASSYLTNRITFDGPPADGSFVSSDAFPIQKFNWWDAQFGDADRGATFRYTIRPMRNTAAAGTAPVVVPYADVAPLDIVVAVPHIVEDGIGTYFNRAVVSSQAFVKRFGQYPVGAELQAAREWLANGLQTAIPTFLADAAGDEVDGAIYHLTDIVLGTLPAMDAFRGPFSLVYDAVVHANPSGVVRSGPNDGAIADIARHNAAFTAYPRAHTTIMHDKFLVRSKNGKADALLVGSANFTTEGLSEQANLLMTFEHPALAALYLERQRLLATDPVHADTAAGAAWSRELPLRAGATVRVFFPPEAGGMRGRPVGASSPASPGVLMQTVIDAVRAATHSVVFALFTPTDVALIEAFFGVAAQNKMLFGLVNDISATDPATAKIPQKGKMLIYDRARKAADVRTIDVVGHDAFAKYVPTGFAHETSSLAPRPGAPPGQRGGGIPPVFVHHKFIVIDAETDRPIIFTGSANMSNNSSFNNDENVLQIVGDSRLAAIYLAEFMRLFEHYRARFAYEQRTGVALSASATSARKAPAVADPAAFTLTPDSRWSDDWYAAGPKANSRIALARDVAANAAASNASLGRGTAPKAAKTKLVNARRKPAKKK